MQSEITNLFIFHAFVYRKVQLKPLISKLYLNLKKNRICQFMQ